MTHTEGLSACARIIRRRQERLETRKSCIRLLVRVAALAILGWLLFAEVFLVVQAPDNGMFPAVKDGDLLVGFRLQRRYLKNDVVAYEADGQTRVGRVLGREGDVVAMDDAGTLLVNGTAQSGEILFPTYAKEGISYPCTVPAGCVFVLGDYRTNARDSREFGCIALEHVKAKIISIFRRRVL